MKAVRHSDPNAFLRKAEAFLLRAEVENNIILGIARSCASSRAPENGYFATVEDRNDVIACAIRTPPNKALISRAGPEALGHLVADLMEADENLPAVLGPEPSVRQFAELWSARCGAPAREGMRQRLFATSHVTPLEWRPPGSMRVATAADEPFLVQWAQSFIRDVRLEHVAHPKGMTSERIREGSLYIWSDERPVSMAGWAGRTARGVRVNFVYTPPEFRGRGYASACVADLTQRLLEDGAEFCCLVTDLANPTSNSIYQRVGYRPVCDLTDFLLNQRP